MVLEPGATRYRENAVVTVDDLEVILARLTLMQRVLQCIAVYLYGTPQSRPATT